MKYYTARSHIVAVVGDQVHHKMVINRGAVDPPACGQLNRKMCISHINNDISVSSFATENLVSRSSCPCKPAYSQAPLPFAFRDGIHPYNVNHHRISPEFVRPSNCVPMALFLADIPPAHGQ